MIFSWQDITAIIVIAVAVIYIILRIFRIGPWKRKSFCETCLVEQPEKNTVEIIFPDQYLSKHGEHHIERSEESP
jgi:hypothetical protein